MSDEKVQRLVSTIFDQEHRATRAFVSGAIHTILDEVRRAGRAEAFEEAIAEVASYGANKEQFLASRFTDERQAAEHHVRAAGHIRGYLERLAKKERESAEDVRKRLGFEPLSEDQKDENFEHNTGAKKERGT